MVAAVVWLGLVPAFGLVLPARKCRWRGGRCRRCCATLQLPPAERPPLRLLVDVETGTSVAIFEIAATPFAGEVVYAAGAAPVCGAQGCRSQYAGAHCGALSGCR